MKIAITGHTRGIGKALAEVYAAQGHEIVGLSKSQGHDINRPETLVPIIEPCDVFINNAQDGFAQTQLLFEVWDKWQNNYNKKIINIGAKMSQEPLCTVPGVWMTRYRVQKTTMDEAIRQLRHQAPFPKIICVHPGGVATDSQPSGVDAAAWARRVVNILDNQEGTQVLDVTLISDF
jgi:NAD(P)-dependent dehydrogenase (short-subunit alcohol dehydrogenase family)